MRYLLLSLALSASLLTGCGGSGDSAKNKDLDVPKPGKQAP